MYLYYEVFNENDPNPENELYEFVISSDGRSNQIRFFDNREKAYHTFLQGVFKTLPLSVCESDAKTFVRTIIGAANGKRILAFVESAITQGLLKGLTIKKIVNLQSLLAKGRLDYIEPKAKAGAKVDIKFNEEDFFYKQSSSKELSEEPLFEALSKMLLITVSQLKAYAPADLKKHYRLRAMALHPDRNNGDGAMMSELNYLWRLYNA